MKNCEGFPTIECPDNAPAVYDMLGYQLCEKCAENWRTTPTREDEHTGAQIVALRLQLATAHEAIGAARALLHEIYASGLYPHSGVAIGVVLMALEKATR